MTVFAVLAATAAAVVAVVRFLRARRALDSDRQAVARERDHLNRTFAYQTGRVQR